MLSARIKGVRCGCLHWSSWISARAIGAVRWHRRADDRFFLFLARNDRMPRTLVGFDGQLLWIGGLRNQFVCLHGVFPPMIVLWAEHTHAPALISIHLLGAMAPFATRGGR